MNIADKELKMPDPKTVPPVLTENEDLTPKAIYYIFNEYP